MTQPPEEPPPPQQPEHGWSGQPVWPAPPPAYTPSQPPPQYTQPGQQGYPSYPGFPGYGAWPPVPAAPKWPEFPHAEPTEYHQMLRTWTYHWWKPVVGILVLAIGMILVVPILALPVLVVGVLLEGGNQDFLDAFLSAGTFEKLTPSGLLYLNLSLAGMILWTWLIIRLIHSMRPRWLASVRPKIRWRFFAVCLGLSVVALIAQFLVAAVIPVDEGQDVGGDPNEITTRLLVMGVIVLFTTPFQAAGEEYAFRGYLMQAVGSLSRNRWVAVIITALLFAAAHGFQNPPLFFDRFMFGFVAGWLVILTGGLEAGIAMHVLNNYLAFGVALLFGDMSDTLNVSEVSWWNIPVTLTQSLVYLGLVLLVGRRMGLQTRTRPPGHLTPVA